MSTKTPSSLRRLSLLCVAAGSLTLAVGCTPEKKPATTSPANEAKVGDDKVAPADKAEPANAGAEGAEKVKLVDGAAPGDERYDLKIDTPEATSGQESKVTVRVVPKGPWHMNLEFPTSLKVQAPEGVTMAKADLKKADAAELTETGCQFDVGFTPAAAGEQTFTGKFKFAVCQDEACSPVTEEIEFKVAVK